MRFTINWIWKFNDWVTIGCKKYLINFDTFHFHENEFFMKISFHIFNADLKCITQSFWYLKIFYPLICLLLLQNFYGVHLILTSCEYFQVYSKFKIEKDWTNFDWQNILILNFKFELKYLWKIFVFFHPFEKIERNNFTNLNIKYTHHIQVY